MSVRDVLPPLEPPPGRVAWRRLMAGVLAAVALVWSSVPAVGQDASSSPKPRETAGYFSAIFGPDSALPAEEQYSKLAFELAGCVALVQVLSQENLDGRTLPDAGLKVRVIREYRGPRLPEVMRLHGMYGEDPRRYPPGSRWLVAALWRREVVEILPDGAPNRAAVEKWTVPGWKMSPTVVVAHVDRTLSVARREPQPVYRVDRVLRGHDVPSEFLGCEIDSHGETAKPLAPGSTKYIIGLGGTHLPHGSSLHCGWIRSLAPVADREVEVVVADLSGDPFGALQEALAREMHEMSALDEAWRFRCAPLVAEVKLSGQAGEVSGAGGWHLSYAATGFLRGFVDPKDCPPSPEIRSGRLLGPLPSGIFYGGGHGYHFVGEKPEQRLLAAGWQAGGRMVACLPLSEDNRRRVEWYLKQRTPTFACRPVRVDYLPASLAEEPGKADTDLFSRRVSLRAALSHPTWCCFDVVAARWNVYAKGPGYDYRKAAGVVQARRSSCEDAQYLDRWANEIGGWGNGWQFEGVMATDMAMWPEGSRKWGICLNGVPGPPTPGQGHDAAAEPGEGRIFLAGPFVPAKFPYSRGLRLLLQELEVLRKMSRGQSSEQKAQ